MRVLKQIDRGKILVAICYATLSSLALNWFWLSGNLYANGLTGFTQLLAAVAEKYTGVTLSLPLLLFLFNLPLMLTAWLRIDRTFTIYTIFAVFCTSVIMDLIPVVVLTSDPVICALFGGALHGVSVGITLRSDFSTGGLDIIGILIRKKTRRSIGSIFIVFNVVLQIAAGAIFGWEVAFYSAVTMFISGRVVDYVNTKHQQVQVMIVTEHAAAVTADLKKVSPRGVTVFNDVEGGYDGQRKKMLMTVVPKRELNHLRQIVTSSDQKAFISIAKGIATNQAFFEW